MKTEWRSLPFFQAGAFSNKGRRLIMWYVVQVRTGTEENICLQCRKNIVEEILEQCFIPHYEERKKVGGQWLTLQKVLFPGYIFAVTQNIEALQQQLWNVIGTTKVLRSGEEIIPLTDQEVTFLLGFGGEDQLVKMSEGIIIGDKVIIHSGPLQGREACIKRIDRHKRKAWLELPFFGATQVIQVGLEIVEKIK